MSTIEIERGSASDEASSTYDRFQAKTLARTPINLAAKQLAIELTERRLDTEKLSRPTAELAVLGILNLVDLDTLPRFTTMNMRLLSAVMFYVRHLPENTITTTNWNSPMLDTIARSIVKKSNVDNYLPAIKRDMLRYARKLFIAETHYLDLVAKPPRVPTFSYNDSLRLTSFRLTFV